MRDRNGASAPIGGRASARKEGRHGTASSRPLSRESWLVGLLREREREREGDPEGGHCMRVRARSCQPRPVSIGAWAALVPRWPCQCRILIRFYGVTSLPFAPCHHGRRDVLEDGVAWRTSPRQPPTSLPGKVRRESTWSRASAPSFPPPPLPVHRLPVCPRSDPRPL